MKPSTWLLALAALLLFAGCSAANAQQADDTKSDTPTVNEHTDVAGGEDGESQPIPAGFVPPFPKNEDFFTPPQLDAALVSNATKSADGTPQVRLLGFVKIEGGEDRALVQIGTLTDVVEPGHVLQGVEVISLQEPTITLQFNGARWTVNMFDQALAASHDASSSRTASRVRAVASKTGSLPIPASFPLTPSIDGGLQLPLPPVFPNVPMPRP